MSNGNLYIFKNLLNTDGKIIKLTNLVNQKMKLFIYEGCPYCLKVRDAMKKFGLKEEVDIELVDAHQEQNK